MVECLPSVCKALSSTPQHMERKERKAGRGKEEGVKGETEGGRREGKERKIPEDTFKGELPFPAHVCTLNTACAV